MGVPAEVKFPPPPVSDTQQRIAQQFLNLSHSTIAQLHKLFAMDFKLFNYDLKAISNSVTYVYVDDQDTNVDNATFTKESIVYLSNSSSSINDANNFSTHNKAVTKGKTNFPTR